VDRLRRHNHLLRQEARTLLQRIGQVGAEAGAAGSPALQEVTQAAEQLAGVLRDLQEVPGYHPTHDQVIAIAVRPLVEQVFRWQQRLLGAAGVGLRLELESDHVEWFPARLRHILDGLLANALKYRDPAKAESWVRLGLRAGPDGYEFRVSDNGVGMEARDRDRLFGLLYRAGPVRAAGLGVGLAVIRWLVEQSGGELTADSAPGQGSSFVVTLPRYDVDDFLV
jgi:signal transduction histidine kinase